jgi:F-type H+-transporting ATPase subunit c
VSKIAKIAGLSVVVLLFMAVPAMAQPESGEENIGPAYTSIEFPGALGAGLVCIGSAYGIGKLAASALEGMARQPEVAGNIQTGMIIAAALIEGFTFYALYICYTQNPFT